MSNDSLNCGVCYSELEATSTSNLLQNAKLLESQLDVIYILKYIYEVKSDQIEPLLRKWGNPGEWIKLCKTCEGDLSHLRRVFQKFHEISRELERAKGEFQDKLKCSEWKRCLTWKTRTKPATGVEEALNECLKILRRRKPRLKPLVLKNPFEEGDLKASELGLTQVINVDIDVNVKEEKYEPPTKLDNVVYFKRKFSTENTSSSSEEESDDDDESTSESEDGSEDKQEVNDEEGHLRLEPCEDNSNDRCGGDVEIKSDLTTAPELAPPNPKEVVLTKTGNNYLRKVQCPVCKVKVSCGNTIAPLSKHLHSCLSSSSSVGIPKEDLKCPFCNKWNCEAPKLQEFLEHILLCRRAGPEGQKIPWRDAVVKCNLCEETNSFYLPFPEYIVHVFQYHQHRVVCTRCPFRSRTSRGILRNHWRLHHKNMLKVPPRKRYIIEAVGKVMPLPYIPWWCPRLECLQEFGNELSRDDHLKFCRMHEQSEFPQRSEKCGFCGREYFSEEELLMHRVSIHGYYVQANAHKCELCGMILKNSDTLSNHQKKIHGIKRSILKAKVKIKGSHVCSFCGKSFPLPSSLRLHTSKCRLPRYKCTRCKLRFATKELLDKHGVEVHTIKKPKPKPKFELDLSKVTLSEDGQSGTCNVCGKSYPTFTKLKDHYKDVHAFTFVCEWEGCGKKYSRKSQLNYHIKWTHEIPPQQRQQKLPRRVICDLCGKEMSRFSLRCHMKGVHEDQRPWSCDICEKSFRCHIVLVKHKLKIHKIESERFECDVEGCSKSYWRLELLESHKKYRHEGFIPPKNFKCRFCGKAFYMRSKLVEHEEARHINKNSKPFKCELCDKTFSTKTYVRNHRKKVHNLPGGGSSEFAKV